MKVSVKDCLQLEAFRKCIVVAGEKHMDRRVKAVSVMDAATAEEAVKCSGSSGNMVLANNYFHIAVKICNRIVNLLKVINKRIKSYLKPCVIIKCNGKKNDNATRNYQRYCGY